MNSKNKNSHLEEVINLKLSDVFLPLNLNS